VSTALVATTGVSVSPGIYLAGIALLSTVLMWFILPETRGTDLTEG
jgi:hypothetical protein